MDHFLIKITFICFIVIHFGNSHKVKTWILSFTIASVQSWMKKMNKNNQSKWGANLEKIKYINFPTLSCFLFIFFKVFSFYPLIWAGKWEVEDIRYR